MIVMRLFYAVWALGVMAFLLNAISFSIFSKARAGRRLKMLLVQFCFCIVWPLAVISPEGRKILFSKINKL